MGCAKRRNQEIQLVFGKESWNGAGLSRLSYYFQGVFLYHLELAQFSLGVR